jgi:hypothetical protein
MQGLVHRSARHEGQGVQAGAGVPASGGPDPAAGIQQEEHLRDRQDELLEDFLPGALTPRPVISRMMLWLVPSQRSSPQMPVMVRKSSSSPRSMPHQPV